MAESTYLRDSDVIQITAPEALATGQMLQLPDGRAGHVVGAGAAVASGCLTNVQVHGIAKVTKNITTVVLNGQEIWWDVSANEATGSAILGDFKIGVAVAAATSTATTVNVDLNIALRPRVSFGVGTMWDTTETLGQGVKSLGSTARALFDATSEAATAAIFTDAGNAVPIADLPIIEGYLNVRDNGSGSTLDINIGLANATHATDADSITESAFVHIDGNVLNILAESDDGTTEVTATDTTVDYVEGTAFFFQWDFTNLADGQLYLNGVLVLPDSVFKLDAATGPMLAILHVEKTTGTSTAEVDCEMWIRTAIDT